MVHGHSRHTSGIRLTARALPPDGEALVATLRRAGLADRMICPRCRAPFDDAIEFCTACGSAYPVNDGVWCLLPDVTEAHARFYASEDPARYGRDDDGMPSWIREPLEDFLSALAVNASVVELGAGRAALARGHVGYVATDFSSWALQRSAAAARIQCDAQALPFADASVDAIFSIATLEHVPDPERALAEIDRCLKPDGRAFLYPAWYVRPWARKALAQRGFAALRRRERLEKLTILVRDRRPYRFLRVLPGRVRREVQLGRGRPRRFEYRRLDPNLVEYLVSDSDAYASLDPQAVSAFFVDRGYRDERRDTWYRRLLYGYEPVVVRKAAGPGPASG